MTCQAQVCFHCSGSTQLVARAIRGTVCMKGKQLEVGQVPLLTLPAWNPLQTPGGSTRIGRPRRPTLWVDLQNPALLALLNFRPPQSEFQGLARRGVTHLLAGPSSRCLFLYKKGVVISSGECANKTV